MEVRVENLSFQYVPEKVVFQDVNFSLKSGEVLSILGANGAGKSTLLNCIAGLYKPKKGEIYLDEKPVSKMSRTELAREMGYVSQMHENSFGYSVLEYVVMGRAPYIPPYGTPGKDDYAIARQKIAATGMQGMENKIFTEMSGGEQQLAVIARVLTQEPKIILLDEPTNHLDYGNQHRMLAIVKQLASEGYIIITTTHNPDHALELGGRVAILDSEGTLRLGDAEEILTAETLTNLYGLPIAVEYSKAAGRRICCALGMDFGVQMESDAKH